MKMDLEAGAREVKAMTTDLGKLLNNMVLMEDITVMWQLKEWLRRHPNVEFTKAGKRMTLVRKRELKAWRAEVKRITRESLRKTSTQKFMTNWTRRVPSPSMVIEFRIKDQNKLKRKAKKLRKQKMGTQFL